MSYICSVVSITSHHFLLVAFRISQPVFARYLNTSVSTVQKWETGAKRPGGMSLKLLSIVRKHGLAVLL